MRQDLIRSRREAEAFRTHRARIAGAALIGLAAVAWWTGRVVGLW